MASDTTRRLRIPLGWFRPAAIAWAGEHRFELRLDQPLNELAHPIAQASLDRIEPIIEKMDRRRRFRLQGWRLRAIAIHGVVSTGAQRRDRLGFSTRRLRHLQFQPNPRRHPGTCPHAPLRSLPRTALTASASRYVSRSFAKRELMFRPKSGSGNTILTVGKDPGGEADRANTDSAPPAAAQTGKSIGGPDKRAGGPLFDHLIGAN